MADLNENLVTYIGTLTDLHVGEVVPQEISEGTGYVWLEQNGEQERECLDDSITVDAKFFDIEIASTNIETVRDETATIKAAFRALSKYPSGFESVVEYFSISDHDDDYVFRSVDADTRVHVAALSLAAHLT